MKRFFMGFVHACRGIGAAWLAERNLKIHTLAIVVVVLAGMWYRISHNEWIAVMLCIALVFSLEMVNTALEILANKINPDRDELIGKAKDVAAGAVLVAAFFSAIIGALVFGKYILA